MYYFYLFAIYGLAIMAWAIWVIHWKPEGRKPGVIFLMLVATTCFLCFALPMFK
jgi:hypothetical protein